MTVGRGVVRDCEKQKVVEKQNTVEYRRHLYDVVPHYVY